MLRQIDYLWSRGILKNYPCFLPGLAVLRNSPSSLLGAVELTALIAERLTPIKQGLYDDNVIHYISLGEVKCQIPHFTGVSRTCKTLPKTYISSSFYAFVLNFIDIDGAVIRSQQEREQGLDQMIFLRLMASF